jgi:secondary thiamine-phosphate synthase enzyme
MSAAPMTRHAVPTQQRTQMIEITDVVQRAVSDAGVTDGLAVVYVPHTTAAVTINENADPDVKHDLLAKLAALVPHHESFYRHDEGNSDSHLKVAAVGSSVTVIVEGGRLQLGRWQGIQFCEFDGPRRREVWVKVVGFGG